MRIRRCKKEDAAPIARLYYETIHAVNLRDHTPEQIEAWAPRIHEDGFWLARFRRYTVAVAEEAGAVVGFAELARDGGIDCFYVHRDHQGRGVGGRLMGWLEREARRLGARRLSAEVSTTARPFFLARGFRVVRRQKKIYRGVPFTQFVMTKRL